MHDEPTGDRPPEGATTREPTADLLRRIRGIHRENERLFEQLAAGERRFRSLARAVWKVQEEERRRVARELHDGLGQTLTALKMRLDQMAARAGGEGDSGEPSREMAAGLKESAEIARHALEEARRLSHLLRPQVLDDLGLRAALGWLARTLEDWTGFRVRLELGSGDVLDEERWSSEVETLAFRVAQEALTNAMKHSGAGQAEVRVERRGQPGASRLALRVEDRGRGFDPRKVLEGAEGATGFGLVGMRDRVELSGGRFSLRSRPGKGTVVEVELPPAEAGV